MEWTHGRECNSGQATTRQNARAHRNILIGVCQGPTTAELSSIPTIDGIVDYEYKTILHSGSTPFNLD